jgi:hypothetical protein
MSVDLHSPLTASQPKFSRYRSVRHAENPYMASRQASTPAAEPQDGVKRSMSRYRRARVAAAADHSVPPAPAIPQEHLASQGKDVERSRSRYRKRSAPNLRPAESTVPGQHPDLPRLETTDQRIRGGDGTRRTSQRYHASPKRRESSEPMRGREAAGEPFPPTQFTEEEAALILEEQKRKDLARLEDELAAATNSAGQSPGKDRFGFFSRKRAATRTTPPISAVDPSPMTRSQSDGPHRSIAPGGGGVVPGTDAPLSAINAGERVRCPGNAHNKLSLTTPSESSYTLQAIFYQSARDH